MLTLPGPEFLALYALLAALAWLLVRSLITRQELAAFGPDPPQLRDPYAIACLRGGARDLLQVVSLSLVLRGQLKLEGSTLQTAAQTTAGAPPIETAVLAACAAPLTPAALQRAPSVRACTQDYRNALAGQGLLTGPGAVRRRLVPIVLAIAVLVALSAAKIHVALSTGHHNIAFLVILTVVAAIVLFLQVADRRTALGRRALAQLRQLFAGLRQAGAGSAPSEAALLAALFGVYALAGADPRAWSRVWAPAGGDGADSWGGDSSSDGGGGGGGGDGGGGGGCGGCGSS